MSQTTRAALLALALVLAAAAMVLFAREWIGDGATEKLVDGWPKRFRAPLDPHVGPR